MSSQFQAECPAGEMSELLMVDCGGVTLAARVDGDRGAPAILLVHGLGQTLCDWPSALIEALTGAGFRVVRFDNRDIGRSTHLAALGSPPLTALALAAMAGIPLPVRPPYTIDDMAGDTLALMDALHLSQVHIVGASMGGMIAQRAVLRAPGRFLSLVCIMSSSGARGLPGARAEVRKLLGRSEARPQSALGMAQRAWPLRRLLAGALSEAELEELHVRVETSARHGFPDEGGAERQFAAILSDRDRAERLGSIGLPALVIHGTDDPLLPVDHGRDLARRIGGARFQAIDGMAHDIRLRDVDGIAQSLAAHMRAATPKGAAGTDIDTEAAAAADIDHVDVLVVGAGLSGIAAAWHLGAAHPDKSLAILEARGAMGGTWDLFRYPGIRSDSDMFTLGYSFKPWRAAEAIADGPAILSYIRETAREAGIEEKIRYAHKVIGANWCSRRQRWTLDIEVEGKRRQMSCGFLFACCGYYRYDKAYQPDFAGMEDFGGTLVHPQFWPEDLDWTGKRVVVIGSGATAVTLLPSLADRAAHVTMLQRSPTYIVSRPAKDEAAVRLRRWLPKRWAYAVSRWKHILQNIFVYRLSRGRPEAVKRHIIDAVREEVGDIVDVERHFTPTYKPWDQRICLVPDGDLFSAIREGRADVVTDHVDRFDAGGIQLLSGAHLPADIIVSATGLELLFLGNIALSVDGAPVDPTRSFAFRGMMYSGVPNLVAAIGYTNASWTLKCELTAIWLCRLLTHMDRGGFGACIAETPAGLEPEEDFLNLAAGYVLRAKGRFPKQGGEDPWRMSNAYLSDYFAFRFGRVDEKALRFTPRSEAQDG